MQAKVHLLTALLAAAGAAIAGNNAPASARHCRNLTVPVTISAENAVFNLTAPVTDIEVANFVLNLGRQGHDYASEIRTGSANVSGTYQLAATYCEPSANSSTSAPEVVQLLTHGLAAGREYWDVPVRDGNYSYVRDALAAGYATLAWDRLGVGASQRGRDAVNEVQAGLETSALIALADGLRAGTVPGLEDRGAFGKVVGVGHSFGSRITYTAAQQDPSALDAVVLTGFSQVPSFFGTLFNFGANWLATPPGQGYPAGYISAGDVTGVQLDFFAPGNFDPDLLEWAFEPAGRPVAVGELLTSRAGLGSPSNFAGPVLVITGNRDIPFCGGDCFITGNASIPSIPEVSRGFFPLASPFEAVVVPDTGHGMNLEFSHVFTYETILSFIRNNLP